jgi:pyridoxamine 5'-phosphate oxidase
MMTNRVLSEKTADPDPFIQFSHWYNEHLDEGIVIPETVTLATASASGRVSARTVLLKSYDRNGFVFFTNYNSKKGEQMTENPFAALLFYWSGSGRQIRIEGAAVRVQEEESAAYFNTRPRDSQLSAWASEQSTVIPDRTYLEARQELYRKKFAGTGVDKPASWGGFRIIPDYFEFWQDRESRLHDRIVYSKADNIWVINRLAP